MNRLHSVEFADSLREIERRGRARVQIELGCRSVPTGRQLPREIGRTLNISRTGVLIDWLPAAADRLPTLGEVIRFDIELPPKDSHARCLRCRGKVVRLSAAANGGAHVALAIEQMEFRDQHRGAAAAPANNLIEIEQILQ